jgi:hypothetical protein
LARVESVTEITSETSVGPVEADNLEPAARIVAESETGNENELRPGQNFHKHFFLCRRPPTLLNK